MSVMVVVGVRFQRHVAQKPALPRLSARAHAAFTTARSIVFHLHVNERKVFFWEHQSYVFIQVFPRSQLGQNQTRIHVNSRWFTHCSLVYGFTVWPECSTSRHLPCCCLPLKTSYRLQFAAFSHSGYYAVLEIKQGGKVLNLPRPVPDGTRPVCSSCCKEIVMQLWCVLVYPSKVWTVTVQTGLGHCSVNVWILPLTERY